MEPTYSEFSDPRLVAIYDTICPLDGYEKFYMALAQDLGAESILDIGCGTGLLTYELAQQGHHMIGLEPAPAMLERARQRLREFDVQWIAGGVDQLGDLRADLAFMTGHVAQFFLEDSHWQTALESIHSALRPGGHLAFESRNPLVQPWVNAAVEQRHDWSSVTRRRKGLDPAAGEVSYWSEVAEVRGDRVLFKGHYLFEDGDERISLNELRFRTQAEIEHSLAAAGFSVQAVYGDWDRRPASAAAPEMIFVAARS